MSRIIEIRNYLELRVNTLTNKSSTEYHEKMRLLVKEFETLTKKIKSYLPNIKGFLIDIGVKDTTHNKTIYSYKHDLIDETIVEFQLDKSKRTKEWLDARIIEISAKCMDYRDELLAKRRKELSLAKRRVNRFIRSR